MASIFFDRMIPGHEGLAALDDAPLLPKQLELGRAGFHVERVYLHYVFDEAEDEWTAGVWYLVHMSEGAEHVWREFYSGLGFERIKHLDGWDPLQYARAMFLLGEGGCITDRLWMDEWLLKRVVQELPAAQICRHRMQYELSKLNQQLEDHADAQADVYTTFIYNVESLKPNDLRVLFREYYSYEIVVDDTVVYVGKGKGHRCAAHLTREEFQRFDELNIRVYRHFSEALALEDEARRIRHYGIENLLNKVVPSGMDMSA